MPATVGALNMPITFQADYFDELFHTPAVAVLGVLDLEARPLEASPAWHVPAYQTVQLHWTANATGPAAGGNLTFPLAVINQTFPVLWSTGAQDGRLLPTRQRPHTALGVGKSVANLWPFGLCNSSGKFE